jgi:K+-sensing histidine kinase KdpD
VSTLSFDALTYGDGPPSSGVPLPAAVLEESASRPPALAYEYLIALVCVGLAAAVRSSLEPVLAGTSPLLLFVLPTVVMVMRNVTGPALFAAGLSAAAGTGLFVQHADPLWWASPAQVVRLAMFLAVTLTIVALGSVRRRQQARWLESERLRVVHLTMRTVQHIVNNSLNQLQLLRLEVAESAPPSSLALFDETIQDTAAKLSALASLGTFREKRMAIGTALDDGIV